MAVHGDYPGLKVQIVVKGKPLDEYEHEEEEELPKTTTRYVECHSGAEFAIKTKFTSPFPRMDLSIVEGNSNETFEDTLEAMKSVGTIHVTLTPILSYKENSDPKGKKKELSQIEEVSEEAVKGDARSHVIRYVSKKAKEPLVAFRFKYRSFAALKSLGILPRSPSPSPQPEPVKEEVLPQPTPNIVSPAASPAPPRQNSTSRTQRDQAGLTKKDMLILIKHYRGSSEGLEGLPEKELAVLLSSYRDDEPEPTPIKRESVDDGDVRRQAKKRKPEVIVLDD
ncbi:uncharacterized protein J4E79_008342 [Alternaria viburni]|uniref:uncharacterized protein n=1 Tax=Alternaria viburni TaxID=566460 RepID=UPI0020C4AFEA|nr:uncharacterized protein J4E79_008342 [Alternaria viburni]KAI4655275.1 hypothetical protein J4E79_008342 [Alternaria viburni]